MHYSGFYGRLSTKSKFNNISLKIMNTEKILEKFTLASIRKMLTFSNSNFIGDINLADM